MSPDSESSPRVPWLPVNEGAQPAAPAPAEPLTPNKPTVPAWIQRDPQPQPVEEEDAGVVSPVQPPLAQEVLPPLGVETTVDAPADEPRSLWNADPVHLLGESAVASAALSAAGAPTPLGGVPVAPAVDAVTPPMFGDSAPAFTPRFEAPAPNAMAADLAAADLLAQEQERLAARATLLDGGAAYTPRSFAEDSPTEVLPASSNALDPASDTELLPIDAGLTEAPVAPPSLPVAPQEDSPEVPPRGRRRWWLWVLLALVGVAAIVAAVMILNRPAPVVIPGTTVTLPPAAPTITPTPAPTGSDFQAAMPTEVGAYALVEATPLEPADVALTAGRIADGVDLTYRSGSDTMTVRALQYYNEDDATQMFTQFAGDSAVTEPVEAGGTVVGESAAITSPAPGIVWRNGSAVFILTGPPAQLADFYAQFGL